MKKLIGLVLAIVLIFSTGFITGKAKTINDSARVEVGKCLIVQIINGNAFMIGKIIRISSGTVLLELGPGLVIPTSLATLPTNTFVPCMK